MNVAIRVLCWGNVCDCEALYATFDVSAKMPAFVFDTYIE